MKCVRCKKIIPKGSKYCNHCGFKQVNQKLYRRDDGLYEKKITINGKRKYFRGKTEKEVFDKIANYSVTLEEKSKGIPFEEVAEEWFDSVSDELAYSTIVSYRPKKQRAVEFFEDKRINEISLKNINLYIKKFPNTWGMKTATGYLSVLKLIFLYAEKMEYIENNPCTLATIPKGLKKQYRRAVTQEEISVINSSISKPGGLIAYFILCSGLRRGEVMALTWEDIDFDRKIINVTKSVAWHGNTPHLKEPKTEKGKRKVILLDCLASVLKPFKKQKTDLIFPDKNGELYKNSNLTRLWNKYQSETGLTDVTPHMIRHGYSTLLYNAGLQAKDMQDLMGHAQFSTTMDIYTEISKERKEETRIKLNDYFGTEMAQ